MFAIAIEVYTGKYPICMYLLRSLISVKKYGYVLPGWPQAARRARSLSRRLIYTIFLLNSCIADQKQFLFPERSAASVVRERLSTFFKKSAVCDSVEMGQRKCTRLRTYNNSPVEIYVDAIFVLSKHNLF